MTYRKYIYSLLVFVAVISLGIVSSTDHIFSIPSYDNTAQVAGVNSLSLTAASPGANQVNLTIVDLNETKGAAKIGLTIERSTSPGGPFTDTHLNYTQTGDCCRTSSPWNVNYSASDFNVTAGTTYYYRVTKYTFGINPVLSNIATVTPTAQILCATVTLNPNQVSLTSLSQSGSVSMTSTPNSNCTWSASSNQAWLTITSSSGGTSLPPNLSYAVTQNNGTARTGTITLNNATLTVSQAAANQPPVISSFTATPASVTTNTAVSFQASVSDPDGTISSLGWNFGDGNSTTGSSPQSHSYTSPGTYNAVLTATDNAGAQRTAQTMVGVTSGTATPGTLRWSKSTGGGAGAYGVKGDHQGNTIVVGGFQGTSDFGSGPRQSSSSAGTDDAFIAKYNAAGTLLWLKTIGNGRYNSASAVVIDNSDNIILTGYYSGTLNFNDSGNSPITSNGLSDIFVAKYSSNGAFLWSKSYGGLSPDFSYSVGTDASSNIIIGGTIGSSPVNFGGGSRQGNIYDDCFILKLDASGNYIWDKEFGGTNIDFLRSIAVDSSGDVIAGGFFKDTVNFGGGDRVGSTNYASGFIAKYSGVNGAYQWDKTFILNGKSFDLKGLTVDPRNKDVVATGIFNQCTDFGTGGVSHMLCPDDTGNALFIARYSSTGNYVWANSWGGGAGSGSYGFAVAVGSDGRMIVVGELLLDIPNFGGGNLFGSSPGAFVLSLTSTGQFIWNYRYQNGVSHHYAVGIDSLGNVVTGGGANGALIQSFSQ